MEAERILIAVAWPYASGPRHIGHVAGFGVPSDVFARYHRMAGHTVLMVSGTDEHGTPITYGADAAGITPREFADVNNAIIVEDLRQLGLTYDCFTRTTTANHYRVVQDVFTRLHQAGYIAERTQLGAVSPSTGRTLPDRYIQGTCPICGYTEARGDQCDNCGNQLDPIDLINPRSRVNGEIPEFKETTHLFFELPLFASRLAAWVGAQAHWRPNVRAFSLNLLGDLKPRAITRDLDWGVPVPLEGWRERPDKRLYVWFDAVIGYLSASIEWARTKGQPEAWRAFWEDPRTRGYYFMGKDNITFHSVMWPAILLGSGDLQLPYDIVSSEYLTMEGKQFSTSRGHVIEVRDFLSRYDPDPLRFHLTIAGPETADSDFTWAEFVRRNNDELVGTWGNLVHRTLVNAQRNFGAVPPPGELTELDQRLLGRVDEGFESVGELIAAAHFKAALQEVMRLAALVNQYLGEEQPWMLIAERRERAASVLYTALCCVDNLNVMISPFLPFSSQKLHRMLGHSGTLAPQPELVTVSEEDGRQHAVLTGNYPHDVVWRPARMLPGQALEPPQALFRKLDDKTAAEELERMRGASGG